MLKRYLIISLLTVMAVFGFISKTIAADPNTVPASKYYGRFIVSTDKTNLATWYISPVDKRRYYFKDEADGYEKIKSMVLGIKNSELFKIPLPSEKIIGDMALRRRLSGCFLLQVENLGRMWYVQPVDLKRYYVEKPESLRYLFDHTGINASDEAMSHFNVATDADLANFTQGTNTLINCNILVPTKATKAVAGVKIYNNTTYNNTNLVSGCTLSPNLCTSDESCVQDFCILKSNLTINNVTVATTNNQNVGCDYGNVDCGPNYQCINNACVQRQGCDFNNPTCSANQICQNNTCVINPNQGCAYGTVVCDSYHICQGNACMLRQGCAYGNPPCSAGFSCQYNVCTYNWNYNPIQNQPTGCSYGTYSCGAGYSCVNNACVQNTNTYNSYTGCAYGTVTCTAGYSCQGNSCVQNNGQTLAGCTYGNPSCDANHECVSNTCVLKQGCQYSNPTCSNGFTCQNNVCVQNPMQGCAYNNPGCTNSYECVNNACVPRQGCQYNNPVCGSGQTCQNNICVQIQATGCAFNNPICPSGFSCQSNTCVQNQPIGCQYNNPVCSAGNICENNVCVPALSHKLGGVEQVDPQLQLKLGGIQHRP